MNSGLHLSLPPLPELQDFPYQPPQVTQGVELVKGRMGTCDKIGTSGEIANKLSLISGASVSPTGCISHPTSAHILSAMEKEMIIFFSQMRKQAQRVQVA